MLRSLPYTKALNNFVKRAEGGLSDSSDSLSAVHPAIRVDPTPSLCRCHFGLFAMTTLLLFRGNGASSHSVEVDQKT